MFNSCYALEKLPSQFKIPEKVTNLGSMFNECYNLKGVIVIPESAQIVENIFNEAGKDVTDTSQYPDGYNTPLVMKYYKDCSAAEKYTQNIYMIMNDGDTDGTILDESGMVTKICIDGVSSQSNESSNDMVVINEDNSDSDNEKIVIEDETDWVTITVNQKTVDEMTDEIQDNSRSVENGESENKEEEVSGE